MSTNVEAAGGVIQMTMESSLWEIPRRAAGRERGRYVILGFLTGFAISAVIGAMLYLYLTVG